MSATIPSVEPSEFAAGDKVQWTKTLSDYPVSEGWSVSYYINGAILVTIATTGVVATYTATITASESAAIQEGDYILAGYAINGSDRRQFYKGPLTVTRNWATNDGSASPDVRSHARRVLDYINALLEGRAQRSDVSYSVQGRSLTFASHLELLALKKEYEAIVWSEEQQAKYDRGESGTKHISARFRDWRSE